MEATSPGMNHFTLNTHRETVMKILSNQFDGGGTELAFVLLTHQPRVRILVLVKFFSHYCLIRGQNSREFKPI